MFRSYYREPDVLNNDFGRTDVPLQVNCAGHESHRPRFLVRHMRHDVYLFYLCDGSLEVILPSAAHLTAGDMILFPAGVPFSYLYGGTSATVHYFVHFTGSAAEALLQAAHLPLGVPLHIGQTPLVAERMDAIFRAFLRRDELFDLRLAEALVSLISSLGRLHADAVRGRGRPPRLERSLSYIHQHLSEPLSVRRLAELEFVSESRYRALFSSLMHMSPSAYILTQRLRAAVELLAHSELAVGAIGAAVGFSDARYFSRVFRRHTGRSPTEFRTSQAADSTAADVPLPLI